MSWQTILSHKDYSEYAKLDENTSLLDRQPFSKEKFDLLFKTEPNLPQIDTILILICDIRLGELLNIKYDDIILNEEY